MFFLNLSNVETNFLLYINLSSAIEKENFFLDSFYWILQSVEICKEKLLSNKAQNIHLIHI